MRRVCLFLYLAAFTIPLPAQSGSSPKPASATAPAQTPTVVDLPVRKVVLYKNGVGYFEHAGTVSGNERVAIEFTSSQLNDVLQSLTVLDQNGGRIADVDYNSTTPPAQQLNTLSIGLDAQPTFTKFLNAMRGARVEVRSGTILFTGRIMDVEEHKVAVGKDNEGAVVQPVLTVVSDNGEMRTFTMTPAAEVRLLDSNLDKDVNRYLKLLESARSTGLRQLTLEALGRGKRELQVSYISEAPVWKSTYRIVFPRNEDADAIVQGWAIVDNTEGADWDNVRLSLVAGSPQSFIQPLSQPLYVNRPVVPIATAALTMPETHEAAEIANMQAPPPMPSIGVIAGALKGGGLGSGSGGGYGPGFGGGAGGGVYRATDAMRQGDVSTNAFDDYFEYALTQPVTIHKNQSAMVPILQQKLPAEHVTLWSERDRKPLRAVLLDNTSKETFDGGSFSIFENGEFAGEGLLDPIHPGEKRLLSYAVDQAVKVHRSGFADTRVLRRVSMHQGVMVETTSEVTQSTYTVTSAADEARTVIVEHTRKPGATLDSEIKPSETTSTAYRFRVSVEPRQSVKLKIGERAMLSETVRIGPEYSANDFLATMGKYSPALEEKLHPLIVGESALNDLDGKVEVNAAKQKALAADEKRDRENVTTLKGNQAAKRFVDELNNDEDQIEAARKEQSLLEQQRDSARLHVQAILAQLSFDTDLDVVTQSARTGDAASQP